MGIIIGKFRKKKSTYDILEKLENEIVSIEEFGRSTEQHRKKVIARFIMLAILIYVILAWLLYLYYNKISSNQKLIYIVPLVAFPFIIFIIKKFLAWYYAKKLQRNEKKLVNLKEEKKKIIDNVMETETYKVAKKILDKFGNETKTPMPEISSTTIVARNSQTGLRQRNWSASQGPKMRSSFGSPKTPGVGEKTFTDPTSALMERSLPQLTPLYGSSRSLITATPKYVTGTPRIGPLAVAGTPLPLPRSILPSNRSVLDKMVDYLVGDGPSNRFALICKKCSCHNGMALKEEFEYLSFRCCYCAHFNPARKKRPTGPKFEAPQTLKLTLVDDSSESDKDTQDFDSEVEEKIQNSDTRRSSSEGDMPKVVSLATKTTSEVQVPSRLTADTTRNSSPEVEKYSDFDKLSDFESREGDGADQSPNDSGISPENVESTNVTSQMIGSGEEPESPMEVDQENSTTELDANESLRKD